MTGLSPFPGCSSMRQMETIPMFPLLHSSSWNFIVLRDARMSHAFGLKLIRTVLFRRSMMCVLRIQNVAAPTLSLSNFCKQRASSLQKVDIRCNVPRHGNHLQPWSTCSSYRECSLKSTIAERSNQQLPHPNQLRNHRKRCTLPIKLP